MIVVYTTVAYATIKDERSFPIRSGLNSDFSAVSAIPRGPGPSDGRPGDADNKAGRRTGKGHESNARRDTRDGPPLSGRQNPAVVFARRWQGGRLCPRLQGRGRGGIGDGSAAPRQRAVGEPRIYSPHTSNAPQAPS